MISRYNHKVSYHLVDGWHTNTHGLNEDIFYGAYTTEDNQHATKVILYGRDARKASEQAKDNTILHASDIFETFTTGAIAISPTTSLRQKKKKKRKQIIETSLLGTMQFKDHDVLMTIDKSPSNKKRKKVKKPKYPIKKSAAGSTIGARVPVSHQGKSQHGGPKESINKYKTLAEAVAHAHGIIDHDAINILTNYIIENITDQLTPSHIAILNPIYSEILGNLRILGTHGNIIIDNINNYDVCDYGCGGCGYIITENGPKSCEKCIGNGYVHNGKNVYDIKRVTIIKPNTTTDEIDELLNDIGEYVESYGYDVIVTPIAPHNNPPLANIWIGYGDGCDCFEDAPKETQLLAINTLDYGQWPTILSKSDVFSNDIRNAIDKAIALSELRNISTISNQHADR